MLFPSNTWSTSSDIRIECKPYWADLDFDFGVLAASLIIAVVVVVVCVVVECMIPSSRRGSSATTTTTTTSSAASALKFWQPLCDRFQVIHSSSSSSPSLSRSDSPIVSRSPQQHHHNDILSTITCTWNRVTHSIYKFFDKMGGCLSAAPASLITNVDGDEDAYHKRYLEDQVLGEGEFGMVKMVHDVHQKADVAVPLACKILRKGAVFKDNVLYSPIKPDVLRGEIEILRKLKGQHYCLKFMAIYETPRLLLLVTEYCGGGEMMEYVASQKEDLRTEDVSRISYQLFSAVHHCATNYIIHRDIKPENCMFTDRAARADLRLIDFGSGTMDEPWDTTTEPKRHETFAGSAFYISPELFQRTYTYKTDVWSAGATLYVLVAGYPSDQLQKAFNIIQTSKDRNLRALPNLPNNMPDSFYEMLDAALTYRHKRRPTAGEIMNYEFCTFHRDMEDTFLSLEEISAVAAATSTLPVDVSASISRRTTSIVLEGSVIRHNLFLGFKKFERSLTTCMAALMSKKELSSLLDRLEERMEKKTNNETNGLDTQAAAAAAVVAALDAFENSGGSGGGDEDVIAESALSHEQKLSVIPVKELKEILKKDLHKDDILSKIDKIPNATVYDNFAYHVTLLRDFAGEQSGQGGSRRRRSMKRSLSFTGRPGNAQTLTTSGGSVRSASSFRGFSMRGSVNFRKPNSVSGGTNFAKGGGSGGGGGGMVRSRSIGAR